MHTLPLHEPAFAALPDHCYARVAFEPLHNPHWVAANRRFAEELGLPDDFFDRAATLSALGGNAEDYPVRPLAGVYSGHQFGIYVPQLGDGRAASIGSYTDSDGVDWEWQLKGAGKTPFSRFADGRAVLRSGIREYLASEAMHGLGIPTTHALALVGGSNPVYREQQETAAVLTRLSPSFIRFGHFEYFHHKKQYDTVKALADFLIKHHYPDCAGADRPYVALLGEIGRRTACLAAGWQCAGFCHGVMNTDNMSVLGLTIDYGPFGFLDAYDRYHICNRSDKQGRYAYNRQPQIAQWNLAKLASCFATLCSEQDLLDVLNRFPEDFQTAYEEKMRRKLGLDTVQNDDAELFADLFTALQSRRVDFTLFFRYLADVSNNHADPLPPHLLSLFRGPTESFLLWTGRYRRRLRLENSDPIRRKTRMNAANPLYTLRNHLLQQAIERAQQGDFRETERLQRCMAEPFTERPEFADLAEPAPEWAAGICVSCSS
ncbi:YdiU family protein [Neisseria sp.]|uniref:protein adenylyltransferase SelO n=1 Tax=Neisseria sp. TaxID=192066 RepID=UPI0035A000B0